MDCQGRSTALGQCLHNIMPDNETKNILDDKEYEGKKSVLVDRICIRSPY